MYVPRLCYIYMFRSFPNDPIRQHLRLHDRRLVAPRTILARQDLSTCLLSIHPGLDPS
jgi:hypothetical protein